MLRVRRRQGRIGCFGFLVGIALMIGGGQGLYTRITNTSPTTMSCADYIAERPSAKWVELQGCTLAVLESSHEESIGGGIERLYIPVYATPADDEEYATEIVVMISTESPEYIRSYQLLEGIATEEQLLSLMIEHYDELYLEPESITGLVRFGIELQDEEADQLRSLDENVVHDFVILDDDEEPKFVFSAGMFGLGGLFFFGQLLWTVRKKD
ncbi:MAG: hypothetical protein GY913_23210 [Proteobacteria bacterium]|nr:hypothetical protein [Pseudomonadota bacterium]MCP4919821.1 hypothetical protein [Pseudomonadota bacterium]